MNVTEEYLHALIADASMSCARETVIDMAREIIAWRECALYDATMQGPKFKGWNRSSLDRCRRKAEEMER